MAPSAPTVNAAMLGRIEAAIMAESALIDKESGHVYWEGGDSSTLTASLYPKLPGFAHVKASVLTFLLLLAATSYLAQWIRRRWDAQPSSDLPIYKSVAVFVLQWTLLRTPKFDVNIVVCLFVLYLLEAYSCSTRRYLSNAISSPQELEEYIENLRKEAPVVTWKVRCFHYERPYWLAPLKSAKALLGLFRHRNTTTTELAESDVPTVQSYNDERSSMARKKVISHQATANYTFGRFQDATIAGVWKRQDALSADPAPFIKITLSKILLLGNQGAKADYFKQQSKFVTIEGMRDRYAEYSTNIKVDGFKRRLLAIRPVPGVLSTKIFRLYTFWIFTLLGLGLPYRIWFSRHCDNLKVTVVKETYAEMAKPSSSWWFGSSKLTQSESIESTSNQIFRQQMQELLLYRKTEEEVPEQVPEQSVEATMETKKGDSSITSSFAEPSEQSEITKLSNAAMTAASETTDQASEESNQDNKPQSSENTNNYASGSKETTKELPDPPANVESLEIFAEDGRAESNAVEQSTTTETETGAETESSNTFESNIPSQDTQPEQRTDQ